MPTSIPRLARGLRLLAGLLAVSTGALHAQPAADAMPLIDNPGLETDADGDNWPDTWPSLGANGAWLAEEGNHFIRLISTEPGKMVMLYREIAIPEDVRALEITWRQRVSDLKVGKSSWFDARIMLEFMDANRAKVGPNPPAPYANRNSDGWVNKSISFLVPENAKALKFMPALFNVESGTYDLDDIRVVATDPAPIIAREAERTAARNAQLEKEAAATQTKAAKLFETTGNLVSNGNFETDSKGRGWPDDWPDLKNNSAWGDENGNRFYRLINTQPGKTVLAYRKLGIPPGTKALEVGVRMRVSKLRPGDMPWFDARIMMDVLSATGAKLKPQPPPIYTRSNTKDGWITRTTSFLVPEGGVGLEFMPSLFEVKAGELDLDDIVIKPIDPTPVIAAAKAREAAAAKARVPREEDNRANWPVELKVSGNRIVDPSGREVWLQGLNVPSLEWSSSGEQVHKSVVVGIDEWNANIIRIPVKDDFWFGQKQPDGGKSYRDTVDQMITLAANRGAYAVLDLHRYRAPTQAYVEFWKDAAARYKNHPAVMFDLMNEPHDTTWEVWKNGGWVGKKLTPDQAAFLTPEERAKEGFESVGMQALLDAVRATGARNIVVVGGLDYAYQLDAILDGYALDDRGGNGIVYSCHIYPWKSQWQKYLLDAAAKHPILLGEVGADAKKMTFMPLEQQEDWETWTPAILGLIQQHRLNWTGWCFHPSASPRMLLDWDYTPTPFWGQQAKDALHGKQFPPPDRLR